MFSVASASTEGRQRADEGEVGAALSRPREEDQVRIFEHAMVVDCESRLQTLQLWLSRTDGRRDLVRQACLAQGKR